MIKIGVSSCFMYPDIKRKVFGHKTLCYLEKDMAQYLSLENIMPILIPDLQDVETRHASSLHKFLSEMNGFVFQGGSDIAPQTYKDKPIPDGKWQGDPYRDVYELKIMDFAIKNNKPVLGICRGFQLMNVYFGGTLYQDIETRQHNFIKHRDAEIYDQLNHGIEFTKGKLLDRLYKTNEKNRQVNSIHHQGIKEIGKELEVLAHCPEDGLTEAFLWKGVEEGKVIGIQWHPEFFYNCNEELINPFLIYEHFLTFCQ